MSQERLSMRKISEVLRLVHESKLSNGQIAGSLGISKSTVAAYLALAKKAGVVWPLTGDQPEVLTRLFPEENPVFSQRPLPEMATIHLELKKAGVTLQLLWEEYRVIHPEGYQYTQFCHYYRKWEKHLEVTMRQDHVAGEKMFVDYSGDKFSVVDSKTGEVRPTELFIAVLGASNYTYVEATWTLNHTRLDYFAHSCLRVFWRCFQNRCPRQSEKRGHQNLSLRTGHQSRLSRSVPALWNCSHSSPSEKTKR